ncbi:hypothetical protein VQL36_14405 [Chengkuizengella sp. SCS-71B]|uniref:hypothetical protein n=1 Tax=Chengkuizengella sp. SCS-71B TaxID=3115290 RepID=UPI0032C23296
MTSKKGFNSLAAIVLVLFILLVIILMSSRGRLRYGSGGSLSSLSREELLALQAELIAEIEALRGVSELETPEGLIERMQQLNLINELL